MYTLKKFATGLYTSNFASNAYVIHMQWRILFMCKKTSRRVHVDAAEVSVSDRRICRVLFACLSLKCTWSLLKVKSELCWRQLVPLATLALRGVLFMLHIPTIVNNITFRNPESLSLNGCVPYSPLLAWNNASQWFSIPSYYIHFQGQPYNLISHFLYQFMRFW